MHKLEPGTTHPLLWALTELLGLSQNEVIERADVTRADIRRLTDQHPLSVPKQRRLHSLLERTRDQVAQQLSPPRTAKKPPVRYAAFYLAPELYDHRRHTFALVNWVLATFAPAQREALPRETDLSVELLSTIGRGTPRARVLGLMRLRHRHGAVLKCARRLGVREVIRDGRALWLPPVDVEALRAQPKPVPRPVIRRGRRASEVQGALERYLVKRPEGVLARDAIAHTMERARCNRTAVLRAARDLRLIRETTGFGSRKRTTWIYQAAIDAHHADERRRHAPVDPETHD